MKFTRILFFAVLPLFAENTFAQAPGCPDVDAGPDQLLDCVTSCTNLSATIFQSGETSDYTVSSIPYAPPFPFTGGTQVFINVDDLWTNPIPLPFNFCFYGNMYNRLIVGTNGILSFELMHANLFCAFEFTAPIPTPGPTAPVPGLTPLTGMYNNSINGALHDIDPAVQLLLPTFPFIGNPANINYAVLGTAPCRTFVVNFSTVPQYQCNDLRTTQQIVLYETTNVIEVYIKDKGVCLGWKNGRAVIGIQNSDGTKGIAPPNRNTGTWTATNEAWRFTPSGTPNWTLSWFDPSGALIGNTATINVCPTGTSTYTVQGVYQACDYSVVTVTDQVTVSFANAFTTAFTKADESCAGCDGEINVTLTGGTPPFTYDIGNGGQPSGSFTGLCDGNYTISITDAASCDGLITVTIDAGAIVTATASSTNETCAGESDGTITLTASGGTAPYTFNIGFGTPNNTGIFNGLPPNTYNYTVTDANGCPATGSVVITTAAVCCTMTNTVASTPPTCNGSCDATITLTENLGIAPVRFSINNGTSFQTTGVFTGLCAGTYAVLIEDAGNCQFTDQVVITDPAGVVVSATSVDASCGCDASLSLTASGGAGGPFQYSVDGGTPQSTPDFTNVCPGNRMISAFDSDGCEGTATVTVSNGGNLAITHIIVENPTCNGVCDASITINATGAAQYSIDNGASFQPGNTFQNLCPGVYNIIITDGGICQITDIATITDPTIVTLISQPTDALCHADCNGSIDNTATGGTPPYQYSRDNGSSYQAASLFTGLCAGAYSFVVSDANGCTASSGTTISEPSAMSVLVTATDASCPGVCNGSVEIIAAGGTAPYLFNLPDATPDNTGQINGLCAGDFQLTVTDDNNCAVTSDFSIDQPEGMTISAGADDSVRIGESVTLNPSFSDESLVNTLIWTPEAGLSCTNCVNPVASPLTTTSYLLVVDDAQGCSYTDTVDVIVFTDPLVNIPNAFTPNGDGLNEQFLITAWEVDVFSMLVFDRWGEKVFETNTITTGWDGTFRGKKMQPGVYTYLIRVTYLSGVRDVFKGSLTLLQ